MLLATDERGQEEEKTKNTQQMLPRRHREALTLIPKHSIYPLVEIEYDWSSRSTLLGELKTSGANSLAHSTFTLTAVHVDVVCVSDKESRCAR